MDQPKSHQLQDVVKFKNLRTFSQLLPKQLNCGPIDKLLDVKRYLGYL